MSIISQISPKSRNNTGPTNRAPSPYDGLWINAGVTVGDEENGKFVRLNRGIAVGDLAITKIYDSTPEERAAELTVINSVIEQIQAKALTLAEGESMNINLEMVLYRRQEESVVKTDLQTAASLERTLFGKVA